MTKQLILLFFFLSSLIEAQELKNLELAYDNTRVGDKNQALGIQNSLRELKAELHRPVFLAVGSFGLKEILKQSRKDKFLVYVSHQESSDLFQLINKIDILALPHHSVSNSLRKAIKNSSTKLIETVGVAHNLKKDDLKKEWKQNRTQFPNAKKYLVVMLGGDSLNADNIHWTLFNKEDAKKLAHFLIKKAKKENFYILVFNGPRTGMHDEKGEIDKEAHRGNLDKVTNVFVKELKKSKFTLLDFQYDKANLYKASLGLILQEDYKHSVVLIPAESTSMVSEAVDTVDTENIWVYEHSASLATHHRHVSLENDFGRIGKLLDKGFRLVSRKKIAESKLKKISAAKVIAMEIQTLNKEIQIRN